MLRRSRRWFRVLLVLFALYVVGGFFLVPWALRQFALPRAGAFLQAELTIDGLRSNPFRWSLAASGIRLQRPGQDALFEAEELALNLSARSLLRLHPVLTEVRLTAPTARIQRAADGSLNWEDLLAPRESPPAPPEPASAPPRLEIESIVLAGGRIELQDAVPRETFALTIAPLDLQIEAFTTYRQEDGRLRLEATTGNGGRLVWEGSLNLVPLATAGRLELDTFGLEILGPYLEAFFDFEMAGATMRLETAYSFRLGEDGIEASTRDGALRLGDIALLAPAGGTPFFTLETFAVEGVAFDLPTQTVAIGSVRLANGQVAASRTADGSIDLAQRFAPRREPTDEAAPAATEEAAPVGTDEAATPAESPWQWSLDTVALQGVALQWDDQALAEPVSLVVQLEELEAGPLSSDPENRWPIRAQLVFATGGQLDLEGAFDPDFAGGEIDLTLTDLGVGAFQAYWQSAAAVGWESGRLSARSEAQFDDGRAEIALSATLDELRLTDPTEGRVWLDAPRVAVDGLKFASAAPSLSIESIAITEGWRLEVHREASGQINLAGLTPSPPPAAEDATPPAEDATPPAADAPPEPAGEAFALSVEALTIADGDFVFTDEAVSPAVTLEGKQTRLSVRGFSNQPGTRAEVDLQSRLQGTAPFTAKGPIHPGSGADLFSDLTLRLEGLEMTVFSSYAGRYLGQRIERGKLSLDQRFQIENQQLNARNEIRLDQFSLGERVESPEALNLPIGLALALYRGPDGVVAIDLPLRGDLDAPAFSLGGLVLQAFSNLIVQAASAPFRLLGSLIPNLQVDLSEVPFEAGSAEVSEAGGKVLDALAQVLTKRPDIRIELIGRYAEADEAVFRRQSLEALLQTFYAGRTEFHEEPLEAVRPAVLQTYAVEQGLIEPPPADAPPPAPTAVEEVVLASLYLDPGFLRELATTRAEAVHRELVARGVASERSFRLDPPAEPAQSPRVALEILP